MNASVTPYPNDLSFVPADLDCADWDQLKPLFDALLEREIETVEALEKWLIDRSELDAAISEAKARRYIAMTCDTEDEDAKNAFLYFITEIEAKYKIYFFKMDQKYTASPARLKLDRERYLVLDRNREANVTLFREENVPLEAELEQLDQKYNEICGAMTCEFDGKEQTMPQMRKYQYATDRDVRERSWKAVMERRAQDADQMNDIFDKMLKIRHQVAQNADLPDYRDFMFKTLHRFDYGPAECERFHQAAEEIVVPLMRELNEERRSALGVEKLRPWDLTVDVQGRDPLSPFETADELIDRTERAFGRIDPSLGEMFSMLRAPGCLDLDSRKGKAPGGYQYNRDRIRLPFIFMNASGLPRDVMTLLHEGGHAFHSILSMDEPIIEYRHCPSEFSEVASMTMELLALPFLDEFYSEADVQRAVREQLEDVVSTLPWIATIDAFQHWIYTNPTHTREERTAKWLELDARFGPKADWSGIEPSWKANAWQRQLHLFGVPFYYIEYGIAQLGALQIWLQYKKDPAQAVANYKHALAMGGSRPIPELFEAAGAKFDFGPETVGTLIDEVKHELNAMPV